MSGSRPDHRVRMSGSGAASACRMSGYLVRWRAPMSGSGQAGGGRPVTGGTLAAEWWPGRGRYITWTTAAAPAGLARTRGRPGMRGPGMMVGRGSLHMDPAPSPRS
ncbi:hypothetical protein GCM10027259_45220 [Micromonospora palomenae]